MTCRSILVLTISTWVFLFSGCAPRVLSPSIPPLNLKELDTSSLQGKMIVIDPGHGGVFTGAVGVQGIRESDVNLSVALNLWGLLKEAGAVPDLTRSADLSLISSESRELKEDLEARVAVVRRLNPDLFISVHHNSDIHHRSRNETEFYYQLTDPGASQDLARAISRAFAERMEIPGVDLRPGNFYVLRNNPVTAILGEASFVSNKPNERRIALYGFQRLEAEAYFLGILDYFRKGIPTVRYVIPPNDTTLTEDLASVEADLGDTQGGALDLETLRVFLDDQPISFRYDSESGRVTANLGATLANTAHRLRVQVANRNGQWAPRKESLFRVHRPVAQLQVETAFPQIPPDGESLTRLRIQVRDTYGIPVADQTPVSLSSTSGEILSPTVETTDGIAIGYLRAGSEPAEAVVRAESGGIAAQAQVSFRLPEMALLLGQVLDPSGKPVAGVELRDGSVTADRSDADGYLFFQNNPGLYPLQLRKNGYQPLEVKLDLAAQAVTRTQWELIPLEGGVLLSRKIALDFDGNDENAGRIVRLLDQKLEEAGATVVIPPAVQRESEEERTLYINRSGAGFLLTLDGISDDRKDGRVGYYYSSEEGKKLAQTVGSALGREIRESSSFLVIHTGMPAALVILSDDLRLEEYAEKLYQGIVSFLKEKPLF
ncbi:MAG: N-acetylmuramoyl-L-alanine amidase [Nitrospirae bacterium]|nr:N-acetylmuramoyl-L-alanine amidase [Nitrospirota bacterium]